MLAWMILGMLPALAPTGTSSVSSSLCLSPSSNLHDDFLLDDFLLLPSLLLFLTILLNFLAMLMVLLFLAIFLMMTMSMYFPMKCSHNNLSYFQVPPAVEKMMMLQSHLVDLYPPEKEEDDDPDGAGISKQLMADALSLAGQPVGTLSRTVLFLPPPARRWWSRRCTPVCPKARGPPGGRPPVVYLRCCLL